VYRSPYTAVTWQVAGDRDDTDPIHQSLRRPVICTRTYPLRALHRNLNATFLQAVNRGRISHPHLRWFWASGGVAVEQAASGSISASNRYLILYPFFIYETLA
jgi:hypothetical protein